MFINYSGFSHNWDNLCVDHDKSLFSNVRYFQMAAFKGSNDFFFAYETRERERGIESGREK